VWRVLRTHLDFQAGRSSIVFISSGRREELDVLHERAVRMVKRRGLSVSTVNLKVDTKIREEVRRQIPGGGLLWVQAVQGLSLTESEVVWRHALHGFNELRTPLDREFAGTIVFAGDTRVPALAFAEAADLWSVRSWDREVRLHTSPTPLLAGTVVPPRRSSVSRVPEFAGLSLEGTKRTATVDFVLDSLRVAAHAIAAGDGLTAQRNAQAALARAEADADNDVTAISALALIESSIAAEDWPTAVLPKIEPVPLRADISRLLARARGEVSEWFGRYREAMGFYAEAVAASSVLDDGSLRRRQLHSLDLDSLGRAAFTAGAYDQARGTVEYALRIDRQLAVDLGTIEARSAVASSLNLLGRIAEATSDLRTASTYFIEAHSIRESLAAELPTDAARRDLSISINDLGRIAEGQGDLVAAERWYRAAYEFRSDVVATARTPELVRDLAISLDNLGRVTEERGDDVQAAKFYDEALRLAQDLADLEGSHEARRDLAISLSRVAGLLGSRGEGRWAKSLLDQSIELLRGVADALDSPTARDDLARVERQLASIADVD
jgi:tetratricopeptide (TPR) repeat protein